MTIDFLKFADDFLNRLRKILNYLAPGAIQEVNRNGVRRFYFRDKKAWICVYNVYPGGVQLIFKQPFAKLSLDQCQEYSVTNPPDWVETLKSIDNIIVQLSFGMNSNLLPAQERLSTE